MPRTLRNRLLLVLVLVAAPIAMSAETLLINQVDPYLAYGYGLSSWNGMSSALDSAFGAGNITVNSSPLDNLAYLESFDRLFLTARSPSNTLSAPEIANIEAYIATGRRVALLGENSVWTTWNNSILSTVSGVYSGTETSNALTPVVANSLTAGITSLNTNLDGVAGGGTSLFNENVATLWSGNGTDNVFSLLSVNVLDDANGGGAGNVQFKTNVAQWLAGGPTGVPEPTPLLFLGASLSLLFGLARRKPAS